MYFYYLALDAYQFQEEEKLCTQTMLIGFQTLIRHLFFLHLLQHFSLFPSLFMFALAFITCSCIFSSVNCIVYLSVYKSFRQALFAFKRLSNSSADDIPIETINCGPENASGGVNSRFEEPACTDWEHTLIMKTSRSPSFFESSIINLTFSK